MKGTKVASIPHPLGTRKQGPWTPQGQEHFDNERSWRSAMAERQDRTHIEKDVALGILGEIDRLHPMGKGGTGLEDFPGLRPLAGHIFARRRELYAEAKAAGLAIPELLDRPRGQQQGLLYDVLVVGAGVTSVKPGDVVVVNCCHGRDLGDSVGAGIYDIIADVDYVDRRTHETERARHPDGTRYTYERRMSDCERASGGFVLAVLVDD